MFHESLAATTDMGVLPEFAWLAGKIFGLARATCFTNGEIGTGNAEFSEPDEVNIFCLNSAFRNPNSELNGGSDFHCLAGHPDLRQRKGAIAKRFSSKQIPEDPELR